MAAEITKVQRSFCVYNRKRGSKRIYQSRIHQREKEKMGGGGVSHQRDRYSLVCTGHLLHDKLSRPRLSHRRDCSSSAGRSSSKPHSLVNCHSVRWLCSIYCVLCICFYIQQMEYMYMYTTTVFFLNKISQKGGHISFQPIATSLQMSFVFFLYMYEIILVEGPHNKWEIAISAQLMCLYKNLSLL